jgi:hypothetical protein
MLTQPTTPVRYCVLCGGLRDHTHDAVRCDDRDARRKYRYASARAAGLSSADALALSKQTGPLVVEVGS